MELSTRPLSVAEPAFHSIAANYLSGSLQTDLSLSASCRTATEASYSLYTQVCIRRRTSDRQAGYMYFWSKYLLKCQIERSNSILTVFCTFTSSLTPIQRHLQRAGTCELAVEDESWELSLKSALHLRHLNQSQSQPFFTSQVARINN